MSESIVSTAVMIFTLLVSYQGIRDSLYFDKYNFHVDAILIDRQWYRLISSGFLHGGWFHLVFNMVALLSFGVVAELHFGIPMFALMYFVCMAGGSLLSLYIHRNHGDYRAVGASGAISGVIFSTVILYPESSMGFILLPISFPAWVFGLAFTIFSIFGIKKQIGNIGHAAHLGGAITGIIFTVFYSPSVVIQNWWIVILLFVPSVLFLYLIATNPNTLLMEDYWGEALSKRNFNNPFQSSNTNKAPQKKQRQPSRKIAGIAPKPKEEELNDLLDKISRSGVNSLSAKERKRLSELRDEL